MSPDRWRQVKEVLCAALDQEPQARDRWLNRVCGEDAALHREVQSLIAAHEGPPNFIDVPVMEHARFTLPAVTYWPGRTVGRYRIGEEIGRGGMSAVFRATRIEEQFEHEVAVKLLHRSHDADVLMRRFRTERQMLARLNHPNIAHLMDGASTEDGVPYLVMEYVRGETIDAYCDRRRLDLTARLRLFRTLCGAVHHVHRHLMVHGDIKCTNVLVNEDGIVKLLDFGIAKLLDGTEHGAAFHRHTCTVALTPESASPEQIRNEPLTTASDVYSLGILLYRLLTAQPAYRPGSDAYYDLARHICEQAPRRPSAVVQPQADAPCTAAQLRGDLDNIVMKALQKSPELRYGSVEEFSRDIALYLGGFPVTAAQESKRYRLRKFVGRNRALVAVGLLLGISMTAGIVATSWQTHLAHRERERAQRYFDSVRGLAQTFMLDVHDSITPLPGTLAVREKIIGHSLRYLDALAIERADDAEVRRDLARAYERVGDLQADVLATNLQNNESAVASLRKSRELRDSLWAQGERDTTLLRERLLVSLKLAQYSQANRAMTDAAHYAAEAVDMARLLTQTVASPEDIRLAANTRVVRGTLRAMMGDLDPGLQEMREGMRIYEQQIRSGDTHVKIRRNLAGALCRSGDLLSRIGGRHAQSYPLHLQSLEIFESLIHEHPLDPDLRKESALVLMDAGEAAARIGRAQEGLDRREQAVEQLRALSVADPHREEFRFTLGWALGELAASLAEHRRPGDAAARLEEAQSLLGSLSGAKATRLNTTQFLMAMNDLKLGQALMSQAGMAGTTRERQVRLWREARALLQRSMPTFIAAEKDAVLAAEAQEHLGSVQASLHACDQALGNAGGGATRKARTS